MTDDDLLARARAAVAAPAGVQQQRDAGEQDLLARAQRWYGGANAEGMSNGYDTPFFQKMFEQQQRAADNGTMATFFEQKDATGVVTYDHGGMRADGSGQRFRFGDVYADGKYQGNLYETYGPGTADLMMADFTLDAETKARAFSAGGTAVHDEVQRQREKTQAMVADWVTQQEYQGKVDALQNEWQQGSGDDIATIAGGAAAGAVTWGGAGAAVGSVLPGVGTAVVGGISAVAGGIVGGVSAWLNRDELTEQAARAKVQQDMAGEMYGDGSGFMAGLQGWSGLAQKAFSPLSNLTHGAYDATEGRAGDGESEWYAVDEAGNQVRPGWLQGVDTVASVGDAAVQFLSPLGQTTFMTTMGGSIVGQVGTLGFTGGSTFDDRSGTYDNIFKDDKNDFDWGSAAAGIGNIGIDVVQLAIGRGIGAKAAASAEAVGARAAGEKLTAETVGGFRYTLDDAGIAISRRPTISLLAPSETIQAMSARVLAMRTTARESGALTADDFYRAAEKLASGERALTSAIVTGFAEGAEEGTQAILEPLSHNADIDMHEVWNSSLQGFAMGFGMSAGGSFRGASANDRMYAQAFATQYALSDGKTRLSRETWDALSQTQKRQMAAIPRDLQAGFKAAADELQRAQRTNQTANIAAIEKWVTAVRKRMDIEAGTLTERTDGAYVITQTADADVPNNAAATSLLTLRKNVARFMEGFQIQLDSLDPETQGEMVALFETTLVEGRELLGFLEAQHRAFDDAKDMGTQRKIVQGVNDALRAAFTRDPRQVGPDGQPLTPLQLQARARATTQIFVRDPQEQSGSYMALMPQVDLTLAQHNADGGIQVSHAVLQAIGGDYDGDKIRPQAQLLLDEAAFADLRSGRQYLGANGDSATNVNIASRKYETDAVGFLAESFAGSSVLQSEAAAVVDRVRAALHNRYSSIIPVRELDKVVSAFERGLKANDGNVRAALINTMAAKHTNALSTFGREQLSNEWLWMDQVIRSELQRFQKIYASHTPIVEVPNTDLVAPIKQTANYKGLQAQKAATQGYTLGLRAPGWSIFRMFQKLHYSAYNAPVPGGDSKIEAIELDELTAFFEELSQGMTRSALEELQAKDEITARVLYQLQHIAAQGAMDTRNELNPATAVAVLANMGVKNIDRNGKEYPGKITLLQLLLRDSLEQDRAEKATILETAPELVAKHRRIEQMTYKGAADKAFVEVFGQVQLFDLIGEAALPMGSNRTVEQYTRMYAAQHETQRQDTKRMLLADAAYLGRENKADLPYTVAEVRNGEVSEMRSVVDAILGAGNKRIAMNDQYDAIGDLGERSDQYHTALLEFFELTKKAFGEFVGYRKLSRMSVEDVKQVMDEHPDWAQAVMALIPDGAANAVFEVREVNGKPELFVSNWVYEMFTMAPEEAAMHYWRSLKLAEWNAKGSRGGETAREYATLDDRIHRLMYRLQAEQDGGIRLSRFIRDMGQAKSLPEFMRLINKNYRGIEPAYTAWISDASEFDPDKSDGGWTSVVNGAQQREAILALRERSERLVTSIHEERLAAKADDMTMVEIGEALALEADARAKGTLAEVANSPSMKKLAQLRKAIEFAKGHLATLGPGAMEVQSAASLLMFYGTATDKGKSPAQYTTLGKFEALGDTYGYMTPFGQHVAAVNSVDLEDVGSNMQLLARDGVRTMDEAGRPIEWEQLTAETMYSLWQADEGTHAAIRAILFPSVWERTSYDGLSQQFLVGKSITELLSGDVYRQMFGDTYSSKMTYVAMVEAAARKYGGNSVVQRFVNDVLIAQSSSMTRTYTPFEVERQVQRAYAEVADLMRIAGELASPPQSTAFDEDGNAVSTLELLKKTVRKRLRDERIKELAVLGAEGSAIGEAELELLITRAKESALAEAQRLDSEAPIDAFMAYEKRLRQLLSENVLEEVQRTVGIDWTDAVAALGKRRELLTYVQANPSLMTKAAWATAEIATLLDRNTPRDSDGLPRLSKAQWNLVSRAIIATYLDDLTTITAPGVSVPLFPEAEQTARLRYWDPTFSYLVDDLLDVNSPLIRAAADLHAAANRSVTGVSSEDLVDKIFRTVLNPGRLGVWTSDIPRASLAANERIDSSPAAEAISMSGLSPMREVTQSAATAPTYELPQPDTLSVVELTFKQLRRPQSSRVPTTIGVPGAAPVQTTMPLLQLNGRFANGATLRYTDDQGQQVEVDLWNPARAAGSPLAAPQLGRYLVRDGAVVTPEFRSITVQQLRTVVTDVLPRGVDLGSVTISLSYIHPDSQPAAPEYFNNVYYEGTSFELDADQQSSLNSSLWFASGSVSPTAQAFALQANKKGKRALQVTPTVSARGRKSIEQDWEQDLAAVLTRKATLLTSTDTGGGRIHPSLFNAVYKDQKMQHFVRGFDPADGGAPVLWTAEQVIAWQRLNPGLPLPLEGAELWVPTKRVLRMMLGELGAQGAMRADKVVEIDPTKVPAYRGVTPEMLQRVPGALEFTEVGGVRQFTKGNLFETDIIGQRTQARLRSQAPIPQALRTKFEQAIIHADARRESVHLARANDKPLQDGRNGFISQALREGNEALSKALLSYDGATAGVGDIPPRDPADVVISQVALRELIAAVDFSGQRMAWVYEEGGPQRKAVNRGPAAGVLTAVSLDPDAGGSLPPLAYQLAPDDLVVVKVNTFETVGTSYAEQYAVGKRRLQRMVDARTYIALANGSAAGDLTADLAFFLEENGYEKVAGSKHLYAPMKMDARYQNERARLSTLTETHAITADSTIAVFQVDGKAIAENAAVLVDPASRHEVAVTVDLVPTDAHAGFNVPIEPRHVALVKAQLRGLLETDEGVDFLAKLSGIQTTGKGKQRTEADAQRADLAAAIERMLTNWDDDPDNPTVTPRRGQQFGPVDIVPLYNPITQQIVLYRHGYESIRPDERDVQFQTALVAGDEGHNLAIYRPKPLPNATTHAGTVVSFDPRSKYGLSVRMRVTLQSLFNKLQLEHNGMKYVTTTMSERMLRLPQHKLFQSWGIDLIVDTESAYSKESVGGRVDNHRNAFAFLGIDFTPDLVRFFYEKDLADPALTEAERAAYISGVTEMMLAIQKSMTISVADARQLILGQHAGALVTELNTELLALGAPGVRKDWSAELFTETASPEAQIARTMMLYLMTPQARLEHVLKSGGFNNPDARVSGLKSVMMPQLFTEFFDQAPIDPDPTKPTLRRHINRKLNQQLNNPGVGREGYVLLENFKFASLAENPKYDMQGWLQFSEVHSSGDNPVLNEAAFERSSSQGVSPHATAMAFQAINARTTFSKDFEATKKFAGREGVTNFDESGALWHMLHDVPAADATFRQWQMLTPAEEYYKGLARDMVAAVRQPLSQDGWEKREIADFNEARNKIALGYGLSEAQSGIVDAWIRQHLGMPLGEGDQGRISASAAMQAMQDIQWNLENGYLPVLGAEIPMIHYYDLRTLHEAAERGGPFQLKEGPKSTEIVNTWEEWTNVALGSSGFESDLFDPMYLLATDGMLHSYVDAGRSLIGLPVSVSVLKSLQLLDPETSRLVISLDPHTQTALTETPLLDERRMTLEDIMGGQRVEGKYLGKSAPASIRAQRQATRKRWREENGVPMPVASNLQNFREQGAQFISDSSKTNALLRIITNLRVGNALVHPALWVSAGPEMLVRNVLEDATNLLMGNSTGAVGRALAQVPGLTKYTPEQMKKFHLLDQSLGQRAEFKGMIYRELMFQQPRLNNAGRLERWTHNWARLGSRLQDPTYGMRADLLARRYREAVLAHIDAQPTATVVSPELLVAKLSTDPEWVRKNIPAAHNAALATIANVRSLKPTPISLFLRGIYEPLSENPNLAVATAGTLLLKLPLMFSGYAVNVATTILGLQGPMSALAMVLEGRQNKLSTIQAFLAGKEPEPATIDMSSVLEGIDLSKAFIQSGLTHTSLFALALAAGGLNLSGEDDEDKRRRRAAQAQGAGYVYDPRKIENDFRNADAIYLDALPFGLGNLLTMSTGTEGGDGRDIAHLNWMLRQFVSPVLGMERFFETGDSRHLLWGYQDAIASFPLINANSWSDAVTTFAMLDEAAKEAQAGGSDADMMNAFSLMVTQMAVMERMLFENSFVNTLYVGFDKYDRDPWVIPQITNEGVTVVDAMGNPRPTSALQSYVDPATGEVKDGYVGRDWLDAQMHTLTENRAGLALMMSLFTGQGLESDYIRTNMAVKERVLDKTALSQDAAEGLVLSIFDESGMEVLTQSGARAVFQGVWKGSVTLDSASLEGTYVPPEMRQAIQEEWMAELIQEGINLGLSEKDAGYRMKEIWYGPTTNPAAIGLGDILWSDKISYTPSFEYNQLNTTYVMGPDGRPWATGAKRSTLLSALGLQPFDAYYNGDVGNLGVDARLNSVDPSANINVGLRGLERKDDSWIIPTAEEIAAEMEKALQKALSSQYTPSSYGGSGYGGGSSGGSFSRLNPPQDNQTPYGNTIPFLNTSNPIIRRASIRRERFSSNRGRLNPWQ